MARRFLTSLVVALGAACDSTSTTPDAPVPKLLGLEPDSVPATSTDTVVRLHVEGAVPGSRARLNGEDRPTTYVSASELEMTLSPSDRALGGKGTVRIFTAPPGGGLSLAVPIFIGHPRPIIDALDPAFVDAGSASITLTVEGSNFVTGADTRIVFGDVELEATVVNAQSATAILSAELLRSPRNVPVVVRNPQPGETHSTPVVFVVAPTPEILAVHPDTLVVGEPVSLYVTLNSVDGVVAVMLGSYGLSALRALSGSVLRGVVPAGPLDEPGILEVTAIAFAAGTSIESEPVSIPVVRRPSVTSIDPTSVEAGSSGATLEVVGAGFDPTLEALWNGVPVPTIVDDAESATVQLSAADVASVGTGELVLRSDVNGRSRPITVPIVPTSALVLDTLTLSLTVSDLAADPVRGFVYGVVPGRAPAHQNEIVAMDPSSGVIVWSTLVGNDPRQIEISDDASFAYVALRAGSIARVDLGARRVDARIALPITPSGPTFASDLAVLPDSPRSVAVALQERITTTPSEGVVIFDDDRMRPGRVGQSNRIEPSDTPDLLYGYYSQTTGWYLHRLELDASGPTEDDGKSGVVSGFRTDIHYDGGFLFATDGSQVDAASFTLIRSHDLGGVVRPDVAHGRVFYARLDTGGNLIMTTVSPFDGSTLGSLMTGFPNSGFSFMELFGVDGMAFGGDATVFFLRSDLIGS